MFKYNNLTFTELVNKIGNSRYWNLPTMLKEILNKIKTSLDSLDTRVEALEDTPSTDIQSVTGDLVDNSDPQNPIIIDAPNDGSQYARQSGTWTEVVPAPTGDFIPLTGTEEGNPVTGDVEFASGGIQKKGTYFSGFQFGDTFVIMNSYDDSGDSLAGIKLQGDGTIDISSFLPNGDDGRGITSSQDFTETVTDFDFVQKKYVDNQKPYKIYAALLTQTGTDAPVATVLENTLGGDVVWSYESAGIYVGTLNGAFVGNKTTLIIGNSGVNSQALFKTYYNTVNDFYIETTVASGSGTNGLLDTTIIEIKVYN